MMSDAPEEILAIADPNNEYNGSWVAERKGTTRPQHTKYVREDVFMKCVDKCTDLGHEIYKSRQDPDTITISKAELEGIRISYTETAVTELPHGFIKGWNRLIDKLLERGK